MLTIRNSHRLARGQNPRPLRQLLSTSNWLAQVVGVVAVRVPHPATPRLVAVAVAALLICAAGSAHLHSAQQKQLLLARLEQVATGPQQTAMQGLTARLAETPLSAHGSLLMVVASGLAVSLRATQVAAVVQGGKALAVMRQARQPGPLERLAVKLVGLVVPARLAHLQAWPVVAAVAPTLRRGLTPT